jgi:transcriptional regulator with XRE-family HTH domain
MGPVIRQYRLARRLSQEALAETLGIDRRTLAALELASNGTTLAMFVLLAQGLEVPPPELLAEVLRRMESDSG